MKLLNKWKENSTPIENVVHTDKHSCKNELIISSKVESVESIFSSLVSQGKTRFYLVS